jgi:hypothetical protein
MKETLKKIIVFLSPFILITLITYLVDPYNLFNAFNLIKDETKIMCINRTDASSPRGNILWRTIKFRRNPTQSILLGTSKMGEISDQSLSQYFSGGATNLAFGGANYRVINDLFWMAANTTKLENVIIQTDFNTYDALANANLYSPVQKILDKPSNYFFNINIVNDAFALLYYSITKNENFIRRSYKYRLNHFSGTETNLLDGFFENQVYPKQFHEELTKISEFCRRENINLTFFIAPDYFEVKNYIKDNNIEDEYNRFRSDIKALGTTVDLNSGIPFSYNKENYLDFFHVKFELTDSLLSMLFRPDLIDVCFEKQ